jgi:hypothetical protein
MILNLRVRPINNAKREIILPRAARTVIKQQPAVTKVLRAAMRPKPVTPVKMTPAVNRRMPVMPKRGIAGAAKPVVANSKPKKPITKIITRDPPEGSTKKLRELHNTCVGRILVIIGNGPSVLEVDTARLSENPRVDVMSINKPDLRVWPTKYWLFCDISQLKRHNELWARYNGYIFNSTMINESRPGTIFVKNIPGFGFSTDLASGFNIGRSSVYAAMQVALWLGYDKIYIFGIDMGAVTVDGKEMLHFYGVNLDCTADSRKKRFAEEAKYYEDAARTLPEEIRKRFYFCSSYNRFKFLDYYNRLDHHAALKMICDNV